MFSFSVVFFFLCFFLWTERKERNGGWGGTWHEAAGVGVISERVLENSRLVRAGVVFKEGLPLHWQTVPTGCVDSHIPK